VVNQAVVASQAAAAVVQAVSEEEIEMLGERVQQANQQRKLLPLTNGCSKSRMASILRVRPRLLVKWWITADKET
jgi:hypothetical protein